MTSFARYRRWIALALALAWFASLGLPAAHLADGDAPEGISILFIGWIAVMMLQPAWLGNLFVWIALPLLAKRGRRWTRTLRFCGIALIGCGIAALFWRDLPDDSGSNLIVAYGAGFYLWMIAIVGGGIAALATASLDTDTL